MTIPTSKLRLRWSAPGCALAALVALFATSGALADQSTTEDPAAKRDSAAADGTKGSSGDPAGDPGEPPADPEAELVGTLQLPLDVDARGAGITSFDIEVPPGTAGVAPALSLVYSSQSGAGVVGVGWSLKGLSRIDRCGATVGQDGYLAAVRFEPGSDDGGDRYCLDGQRLIAIDGVYGADGTVYRTEIDGFERVISHGVSGAGPLWFEVDSPNGNVGLYGYTEDARVQAGAPETPTVRAWLANRISDVSGNYYDITYDEDTSPGREYVYPISIAYTGNTTTGRPPYDEVRFSYEPRPDPIASHRHGTRQVTDRRLLSIATLAEGNRVSEYRLSYDASATTGRSRLRSVTRCAGGQCLRPTQIAYSGNAQPLQFTPALSNLPAQWQEGSVTPGRVARAVRSIFHRQETMGQTAELPHQRSDFDGDGREELMRIEISDHVGPGPVPLIEKYHAFQTLGHDGPSNQVTSRVWGEINATTPDAKYVSLTLDHDGDGLTDLVTIETTEAPVGGPGTAKIATLRAVVSRSDGSQLTQIQPAGLPLNQQWVNPYVNGPTQPVFWSLAPALVGPGPGASQDETRMRAEGLTILTGDVTGDGRDDLVVVGYAYPDDDVGYIWLFRSNGDGTFDYVSRTETGDYHPAGCHYISVLGLDVGWSCDPIYGPAAGDQWLLGDVDGDGRTDVIQVAHADDGSERIVPWRAVGSGFVGRGGSGTAGFEALPAQQILAAGQGDLGERYGRHRYVGGDINGDGLTDLVVVHPASFGSAALEADVWIANGRGYQAGRQGISFGAPPVFGVPGLDIAVGIHVLSGQVDGDGRTDIVVVSQCDAFTMTWCADVYRARGLDGLDFEGRRTIAGGAEPLFHRGTAFYGLDLDGDALTDLMEIGTHGGPYNAVGAGTPIAGYEPLHFDMDINNRAYPDLVTSTVDAFGATSRLAYAPLSRGDVYTRGTGAIFPETEVSRPSYVVAEARADNGQPGGGVATTYTYEGLRWDHARKQSLGFGRVEQDNALAGVTTVTEYEQSFPLTGRVRSSEALDAFGLRTSFVGYAYDPVVITPGSAFGEYHSTGSGGWPWTVWIPIGSTHVPAAQFVGTIGTATSTPFYDGTTLEGITYVSSGVIYGQYGEVIQEVTYAGDQLYPGNVPRPLPTTVADYQYTHDLTNWRLGRMVQSDVAVSDAMGATTRTELRGYDSLGRLQWTKTDPGVPQHEVSRVFTRDASGNVERVDETAAGIARTRKASRDSRGRSLVSTIDAAGHATQLSFDPGFGGVIKVVDPNGVSGTVTYDVLGRAIRRLRAAAGADERVSRAWAGPGSPAGAVVKVQTTSVGGTTQTSYLDRLGRVFQVNDESFDGSPVITQTEYDALGRVARGSLPRMAGAQPVWREPTYDARGRVTQVAMRQGASTLSTSSVVYKGLRTLTTNANGQTEALEVDGLGRVLWSQDSGGQTVFYEYDERGNTVRVAGAGLYEMTYDLAGRRTEMRDADTGLWRTSYDALGQVTSEINPNGQVTSYIYDTLGRRVSRTEPEGTTHWQWDTAPGGIGALAWSCGPSLAPLSGGPGSPPTDCLGAAPPFRRDLVRDAAGRVASEVVNIDGEKFVRSLTYDAFGRLRRFEYPNPSLGSLPPLARPLAVDYGYNARGFLETATLDVDGTQSPLWRRTGGDAFDHTTLEQLGTGTVDTERSYDALGRLTSIVSGTGGPGSSDVQNLYYLHDPLGNVIGRADYNQINAQSGGWYPTYEGFTYDARNRVTTIDRWTASGHTSESNTYDGLGNLITRGSAAYTYGSAAPHRLTHFNDVGVNRHFLYDAAGQMLDDGRRRYTWTSFGKPATITNAQTPAVLRYGPGHERIRKTEPGGPPSDVLYPGGRLFERHSFGNGTIEHHYRIIANGRVVAEHIRENDGSARTRLLTADAQGSTSTVLTSGGSAVEEQSYSPWGQRRLPSWDPTSASFPIVETTAGYTGHETLPRQGLVHMNGRVYDPELGRFTSADPYVQAPNLAQSFNRYAYVMNNPASSTDPSGYWTMSVDDFGNAMLTMESGDSAQTLFDYFHGEISFEAAEQLFLAANRSRSSTKTITLGGSLWNKAVSVDSPISERFARLKDEMKLQMNSVHNNLDHQNPYLWIANENHLPRYDGNVPLPSTVPGMLGPATPTDAEAQGVLKVGATIVRLTSRESSELHGWGLYMGENLKGEIAVLRCRFCDDDKPKPKSTERGRHDQVRYVPAGGGNVIGQGNGTVAGADGGNQFYYWFEPEAAPASTPASTPTPTIQNTNSSPPGGSQPESSAIGDKNTREP